MANECDTESPGVATPSVMPVARGTNLFDLEQNVDIHETRLRKRLMPAGIHATRKASRPALSDENKGRWPWLWERMARWAGVAMCWTHVVLVCCVMCFRAKGPGIPIAWGNAPGNVAQRNSKPQSGRPFEIGGMV